MSFLLNLKRKQSEIKEDKQDTDGVPPPNEKIYNYYIVVKNLCPSMGVDDVWVHIPEQLAPQIMDISEMRDEDGSIMVYLGFKGVNHASKAIRAIPLTLKGRILWSGHAKSNFI